MRLTRRSILRTGTLAAVSPCLARRRGPQHRRARKAPSRSGGTVCRCSATSNIRLASGISTTSIRRRRKLGRLRLVALGTFDNFNQVNSRAQGLARCGCRHDLRHVDGAIARRSVGPLRADRGSGQSSRELCATSFRLRAAARHHDGKPMTVEDVIYSFEAYKKYNPFIGAFYRDVAKVEQSGEREVTFTLGSPAIGKCR